MLLYCLGVTISTHKPRNNRDAPAMQPQDANNRKKFAFLSRETTPDYRPLGTWQHDQNHVNDNDVQVKTSSSETQTTPARHVGVV